MNWLPRAIIPKGEITTIYQQFYFLALILLAFIIPLHQQWTSIPIIILLAVWIFEGNWANKIKRAFNQKFIFLFIGYYFLHITGMLYSANVSFGLFDLQIKLSLLLLPVIIGSISISEYWYRILFLSFILGCVLAFSVCMSIAVYKYLALGVLGFTYIKLAGILMHPGYLSLSFNLALIGLYYSLTNPDFFKTKKIIKIFLIAIFSVFVLLLSARVGVIVLFFNTFLFLIIISIKKKSVYPILLIVFIGGLGVLVLKQIPEINKRWEQLSSTLTESVSKILNKNPDEEVVHAGSSDIRLYIWKAAWEIIKDDPLLGVGTGDVKDELIVAYEKNKVTHAISLNLNAHNQFIQTTVALGGLGFLSLLLSLLLPLISAIRKHNFIYGFFLVTIIIYLLADSFLEVQAGVVIYAFFNALFCFHSKKVKTQII